MASAIRHRGPDDDGVWSDADAGITLGFRRLAIVDLSATGHQPMISASGRLAIVFNGEIYNYEDLKSRLSQTVYGAKWRGSSDTEVLLTALEAWGVEATLPLLDGMFAFALWDRGQRVLTLARDKVGEKPLFYGHVGRDLLFASEIKAFRGHPDWSPSADITAAAAYARFGYIPTPLTIIPGVKKLAPGSYIHLRANDVGHALPASTPYWSFRAVRAEAASSQARTPESYVDELEQRLSRAVKSRMHADVPLGAFLSGGVDSSLVVAMMQSHSTRPIKTFTIGFEDQTLNEAPFAESTANRLNTDHTSLTLGERDMLNIIPTLPEISDEPFGDASIIPTYLVSLLAGRSVKVALSGDGGDELFYGYERYFKAANSWRQLRRVPRPLRVGGAQIIPHIPRGVLDTFFRGAGNARSPGQAIHRLAEIMGAIDFRSYYALLVAHDRSTGLVRGAGRPFDITDGISDLDAASPEDQMMLIDLMSYLPDDILVKVDRASMAASIEGRMPFLDPKVMELAWSIPPEIRRFDGRGKWPLRTVLARYVDPAIFDRPKRGFGVPLLQWLKGPLAEWANDLLSVERVRRKSVFDPLMVSKMWSDTISGHRDFSQQLWNILMFESWTDVAVRAAPMDSPSSYRTESQ